MGFPHVRNNRHPAIFDLGQRADCAQASIRAITSFFRFVRHGISVALRNDADHVIECAWHPFAMPSR